MERKIGETFEYEGKTFKVKEGEKGSCHGCFFNKRCILPVIKMAGECAANCREDNKGVVFVEVQEQTQELNLCEILKDCPKGTKFYSTVFGDVRFKEIVDAVYPIVVSCKDKHAECFSADGKVMIKYDGECCIFPSKEMRDWSKFTAPWIKKERFDPKTLIPFDRVLGRNHGCHKWACDLFSDIIDGNECIMYHGINSYYRYCIPYNDETKHLVNTEDEAPEFYRYWED